MKANPEKFQAMFLNPLRQVDQFPNIFSFDYCCIKRESTCKLLRVAIDDGLRFDSHVDVICKKASRQLNAFMRIKKNLDRKERFLLYKSFILSNFNYCHLVALRKCKINEENGKSTGKGTAVLVERQLCML